MILHDLLEPSGGMSFKRPCLVSAMTVSLFIGANVLDVRSEVLPTDVPGYDGVVRQATAGKGFPFDLRKTIDWAHCTSPGMSSKAEGYLAKYGELRMRHLAQIKEIGAVEPIVVLEAYGNTGRHVVYILAGKTLYRVSWWFMFKDEQEKNREDIKVCLVNDVFVSLVEDGVWSLQRDFKGWEDCGTVFSTAGGFVLFSYKAGGTYRTTVCNTIISIEDVWGFERYRNLFTLLTGKFNADL